jgi:hypothetical protein
MTLKDKFEATKAKIKQNAPAIIATVSTGAVVGFAVARYLNHIDELTLKAEHAKEMLRKCGADVTETHVHTTLDTEAKLANGLKA